MQKARRIIEILSDSIVFLLFTLPVGLGFLIEPFCSGWNEGSMVGTCNPAFLEGTYNLLGALALFLGFGLIIIWGPIVLGAAVVSLSLKIWKYSGGQFPRGLFAIFWEIIIVLPFIGLFTWLLSQSLDLLLLFCSVVGLIFIIFRLIRYRRLF